MESTLDFIVIGLIALVGSGAIYDLWKTPSITPKIEDKPKTASAAKTEAPKSLPAGKTWSERLLKGLAKTREDIWGKVNQIINRGSLDNEAVEELEEILFSSDMSPKLVGELIEKLQKSNLSEIKPLELVEKFIEDKMGPVQEKINQKLFTFDPNDKELKVIMIVGVNGAGKTTTIGKLATKLRRQGATVYVGACDTFRAAAVEQLEVWCKRADVEIVRAAEGADPSGVAFDTVKKAKEAGAHYCLIDTAGRLHTKSNLMDELAKTKKVMSKVVPEAPHETLLVLDAITGQNAMRQAEEFNKSLELTGLIFTKCDGSAKAGSAISIVENLQVPVSYIGVGEDVEDLNIFDLEQYLGALLGHEKV